jgi:hypothetical protein
MASIFTVTLFNRKRESLAEVSVHASHFLYAPAIALKQHKELGAVSASVRIW